MRLISAAVLALIASSAAGETITAARFVEPTKIYQHGVLGDAVEWRALEIETDGAETDRLSQNAVLRKHRYKITLPVGYVFEDIEPRLTDVTGDGTPEVIVVETAIARGAALAIYTHEGRLTKTPHIGQTNRWLAPIGAADLDGDGQIEIAYIDRPHLAKTLRIWRYTSGKFSEIASHPGLTNHKIGWDFIVGGISLCGDRHQIITASGDWSRIVATTFDGQTIMPKDIGPYTGPDSLSAALSCF
ncbi:FG-GAP repeat domain-containing protein [Roseovarius sp. 2305UL8-3]|uniref:FG-GAP repeat domain-containing protein n=1 Tax=Roseovarius conchicola TaxID=3121636 RepID=UPI0035277548